MVVCNFDDSRLPAVYPKVSECATICMLIAADYQYVSSILVGKQAVVECRASQGVM